MRAGAPHPNDIAIIPILIPFVLVVLADLRRRLLFVIGLAVLPLVVVALIASQSRNAWLGLVTAVAVWLALTQRRRTGVVVLAAAAALIVIAYALDLSNVRSRLASLLALHRDGRVGLWIVAWQMFVEAPFFGKGVHVFQDFYPSYLSKVSLPRGYRPEVGYIPWAHIIYLELLAERGLLGLATFATLVVAAAKRVWLCLTPGPIASRRLYAAALASSGATILVMALFDLTFLKDWVCLIFCLLIALCARLPYAFTAPGEPAKTTRPRQPGG